MIQKYLSGYRIFSLIIILFFASCKDPYYPNVNSSKEHYLVVDGYINSNGLTNIRLTRTRTISKGDTAAYINETGATVVIEDDQNNVYPLYDNGNGNYSNYYYLSTFNQYRLHITTSDNKEYRSDFVLCKISPSIDQLGWKFSNGAVQVFINTHDPDNNTRYYRWDYTETWEFHSQYYSSFKYNPDDTTVVPRTFPVNVCYRNRDLTRILLGSSAKLQQDVIHEAPMVLIPNHDKRISVLYSIIVTQYALDSAAYNYWNAMKGNTEDVGSIFGSQPNQTNGNVHSVNDSSETVIGYIGVGSPQQVRIFISNSSMPYDWNQRPNCLEYDVPLDSIAFFFESNAFIPITTSQKGYFSASGFCVDCTLTGSLDKPPFWP